MTIQGSVDTWSELFTFTNVKAFEEKVEIYDTKHDVNRRRRSKPKAKRYAIL